MKQKYHVITKSCNVEFLDWCSSLEDAYNIADAKYGDGYIYVVTDETLYRLISSAKEALNHQ